MKLIPPLIPAAALLILPLALVILPSALLILPSAWAQDDADAAPTFSSVVQRVVLYATVREGKARFVGDLEKQHFTILEDGKQRPILSFSRDDVPVAVGVLVDNSGSMFNKQEETIAATKAFVQASNPGDEVFVLHFNEKLRFGLPRDTPFSGDQALLGRSLENMELTGKTALYDAIHVGLEHLKNSKLTKKALVVFSDGGDNISRQKLDDVVREADLSGALFYAIGIYDPMDGDADPGTLRRLAQRTGGEAYFPKDIKESSGISATIARDLRSQYMLSFSPNGTGGAYHRMEVKVKDPKGRKLIVRTRTGYYSAGPQQEGGQKQ